MQKLEKNDFFDKNSCFFAYHRLKIRNFAEQFVNKYFFQETEIGRKVSQRLSLCKPNNALFL